uniref:Copia protein n=1 Tax=Tanacetum cinerariifolium TaxID=118510 RepID=A0A6L2JAW4_TANCI|nr:copia protein [Tanacetum cinerariifolium]
MARPLKEYLIKFSLMNGKKPFRLDFKTFVESTGLDYSKGTYVSHPSPEVVKAKLAKIVINESYLDKTHVFKNFFLVAWRILFTFVIQCKQSLVSPLPFSGKKKKGKSQTMSKPKPKTKGPKADETLPQKRKKAKTDKTTPKATKIPHIENVPIENSKKTHSPLPKGTKIEDKDSERLKPLADMEPSTTPITNQTILLTTTADVQALLLSDNDLIKESNDDLFGVGEEIDEYIPKPDYKDTQTYHFTQHTTKASQEYSLRPRPNDTTSTPQVAQREGKGIATDEQLKSPLKLIKASSDVRLDPDEQVRVPYMINEEKEQDSMCIDDILGKKLSKRKRRIIELEPKTRIPSLECNRSLPKGVLFVNNMVIEEPEYGMFFIDVFGDKAFQRMSDINKVGVETLSLNELPSRAQSESTRKTLAFSEAVLSE